MDNPERVTYFAATDARGKRMPFGIKQKDRAKHMYVIGKTGMGKSTLLENMAIQDIRNGEGLAFIDPHGGTADKLLDYVPAERVNDVVYFAPFDLERPIAFNVMEDVGYDKRHLVVSGLMSTFKKVWVDAWSARMEYILSNTLLALLEYPDATLLGVNRMYTDKAYRKKVVENVKDPVVKDFWMKEFATYTDRYTQEATPAIQNKIGQFTSNPLIRNIIGQPKSSFDIREMMDQKKIIVINLSKGLVGEVNMRLLGSMLTTRLFLAAMSRADVPGPVLAKLPDFYFYVDEFQNFANETFSEILSEARKYKLNLVIAHQYIEQMDEEVRPAVFGNVGTTVVFRVGPFDAEVLETVFFPEFTKEDLVNLGFAQVYLTLMIDGVGSRPFSAVTIPPIEPPPRSYKQEVIEASRKNYGSERSLIEGALIAEFNEAMNAAPAEPKPRPQNVAPLRATPRPPEPPYEKKQAPPPRVDTEVREERAPVRRPPDVPYHSQGKAAREEVKRPPATRTPEELRAILKNVARSAEKEKEKAAPPSSSLKDALRTVLEKAPMPKARPTELSEKPSRPPENRILTNPAIPQKQEAAVPPTPKPFEVPEETLRSIFKEDV